MDENQLAAELLSNETILWRTIHSRHPQAQFALNSSHEVMTALYAYITKCIEQRAARIERRAQAGVIPVVYPEKSE